MPARLYGWFAESRSHQPAPEAVPAAQSASVGLRRSSRVRGGRGRLSLLLLLRRISATAALVSVDREQRKERPEETSHRTVWSWSQS